MADIIEQRIGGGKPPNYEDDSIRTCGCYEDQGGYHFCADGHATREAQHSHESRSLDGDGPETQSPRSNSTSAPIDCAEVDRGLRAGSEPADSQPLMTVWGAAAMPPAQIIGQELVPRTLSGVSDNRPAEAVLRAPVAVPPRATQPVASLEAALAVPEDLDADCHCGLTPERYPAFGTRCPIIGHRARSGAAWRHAYIKLNEYCRQLSTALAVVQDVDNLWAYIYNRAVEAGTILDDDVVTAIVNALLTAVQDAAPAFSLELLEKKEPRDS